MQRGCNIFAYSLTRASSLRSYSLDVAVGTATGSGVLGVAGVRLSYFSVVARGSERRLKRAQSTSNPYGKNFLDIQPPYIPPI